MVIINKNISKLLFIFFKYDTIAKNIWRGVREVYGARLESVCRIKATAGSNPVLSAK